MTTIRLRRGTAALWASRNHVLAQGEPGYETDTGRIKIGDGVTAWNSLPYSFPAVAATTGAAGFALQNATPTILTATAPADGLMHRATVICEQRVTVAETGGQINLTATAPDGSGISRTPYAGGGGLGNTSVDTDLLIGSGSTVTLAQNSALTAGTAILWAQIGIS